MPPNPLARSWGRLADAGRQRRTDGLSDRSLGGADPDLNGVIAPGDTWETSIRLVSAEENNLLRPSLGNSCYVAVTFRVLNSGSWWWDRAENGAPTPILGLRAPWALVVRLPACGGTSPCGAAPADGEDLAHAYFRCARRACPRPPPPHGAAALVPPARRRSSNASAEQSGRRGQVDARSQSHHR